MSGEKAGITTLGEKKLLFVVVDRAFMEKLAEKPYIEQLKAMLGKGIFYLTLFVATDRCKKFKPEENPEGGNGDK